MKVNILKTTIAVYLLLAVVTVVFACVAFILYNEDLESRTIPQAKRAMVQVSKLLPQLEENEQAVREVYSNLEKKRRMFYRENEDDLDKYETNGESADAIIDKTLSWMNRVTKLRVGRQGHVIVVSKDDFTILAHPNEAYVGEEVRPIGKLKRGSINDVSEIANEAMSHEFHFHPNGEIIGEEVKPIGEFEKKLIDEGSESDDGAISHNFHLFYPVEFLKEDIGIKRFQEAAEAGIYGELFSYKDTYILCGITVAEAIRYVVVRTFFTTLFFFSMAWVFVRFIFFSLIWQKDSWKGFRSKLVSYAAIAISILFVATWYYDTMMDLTGDISTMNDHAKVAVETLNTYKKYRNVLSRWLDKQYLEQCRLAADLVRSRGQGNVTRQDLKEYARDLGVEYIYVFDKKGETIVTNSPYDHFKISNNMEDQSYAFRPLLDGRPYVIQEPMEDESSGELRQYIGVSLRDENDLADGFVQIAVNPGLRERLLSPIDVQTVLDNLVIGLPEYALAIDKDTMKIVATTGLGYKKASIQDIGIDIEHVKKDFNGSFILGGITYYAGISESEDLYLMPLVRSTDNKNAFLIALKLTLLCVAGFFLFGITALRGYGWILADKETEAANAAPVEEAPEVEILTEEESVIDEEDEERGIFHRLKDMIKTEEKRDFDIRWKTQSAIPLAEQSPEMRAGRIVYRLLLVFSAALILFETYLISMGITREELDGFSYVLLGKWERGVSLFSLSYCLFLLCVLYVFRELLNRILYYVARVSDLKQETILLLLRNALKYGCALVFLYIGLAKFGIDTKALWASAGVLSLMVGFGAKDLINDIIAGMFIIFEGTYKIGDFVIVGDWYGTVQEIGIRYTKIGYYSETKVFNNSSMRDFINDDGDVAREIILAPIPYEMDILEIEKLFKRELPLIGKRIDGLVEPPKFQGVKSFDASSVVLRIAIYCTPYKRRAARRAMYREIKLLFDRENISIPYQHVVVQDYKDEVNTYVFSEEALEAEVEQQNG